MPLVDQTIVEPMLRARAAAMEESVCSVSFLGPAILAQALSRRAAWAHLPRRARSVAARERLRELRPKWVTKCVMEAVVNASINKIKGL